MKRVLIITGPFFEDIEVQYPYYRLKEDGYDVVIAAPERGRLEGKHGYVIKADISFDEVNPEEYDALVIPGGRAPEKVRLYDSVKSIVKHFFEKNKPVATICHGPQVLISAGIINGRKGTSYAGIRDDLIASGVEYVDEPVVVDENWVSSRHPGDLHVWMKKFIKLLEA